MVSLLNRDTAKDNIWDQIDELKARLDRIERYSMTKDAIAGETIQPGSIDMIDGVIDLNNNNIQGITPANIADDAAISFTPKNTVGVIFVYRRSQSTSTTWGLITYRTIAAAAIAILVGGSDTEVTTGALTGTTGTDTKMTVSCHTDGKIYIENRRGAAISIHYVLFGA